MSEYKVNHLVVELVQLLRSNYSPDELVKLITDTNSQSQTAIPSRASHLHIQDIMKYTSTPELFLAKYNELLMKNVDSLGVFVELIYYVSKDENTKDLLKKTNSRHSLGNKEISSTTECYPQLKNRLHEVISSTKSLSSKISKSTTEKSSQLSLLSMSSVIKKRPNLSWDFCSEDLGVLTLGPIPPQSQESVLIENLLFVLQGVEGSYIDPLPLNDTYSVQEFTVSSNIVTSLYDLVQQILPLASHYSMVQRFVEDKMLVEAGQVNNALACAMIEILKDYHIFICQLETEQRKGNLTLHKLWFYIQSNLQSMHIMSSIASTIGKANANGGKVLSLLHEHTVSNAGDQEGRNLCLFLTQRAAVPYMQMLRNWIYTGIINDPFKEFLVEDNEVMDRAKEPLIYSDDYWQKRYSIRRERVPIFLERIADMILRVGKYLNVIRQCGKPIEIKAEVLTYHIEEQKYVETIEKAYITASEALQYLLMQENDLPGRLRSIKHYFLLEQGDFIVQFMDLCEKELSKTVNKVSLTKLGSLFDLALRLSSSSSDKYKEDMRIQLLPYDLQYQMFKILTLEYNMQGEKLVLTGLESFSFGYEVKWPVSLVLNREVIFCYQMIFRHLFFCKHVERLLCRVWMCNKEAKIFGEIEASQYRAAFTLRQRMLNCVQNFEYYMMLEVIEPNWILFIDKVNKADNMDEVLECHKDFLDMCLKDCMLKDPVLLKTVTKLLTVCVDFCKFIQRMQCYYLDAELSSMISSMRETSELSCQSPDLMSSSIVSMTEDVAADQENTIVESESFEQRIARFDLQFTAIMLGFIDKIIEISKKNTNDKLVNLLYRLDFNLYYNKNLEAFKTGVSSMVGTSG